MSIKKPDYDRRVAWTLVVFLAILVAIVMFWAKRARGADYQDTLQVTASTMFRQVYGNNPNFGKCAEMKIGRNYDNYVQLILCSIDSLVAANATRTWDSLRLEGYVFTHNFGSSDSVAIVAYEMLVGWQEGYGSECQPGVDTCGTDAVRRYDLGWSTCTGADTLWSYQGADGANTDRSGATISVGGNHGTDTTVIKSATLTTSAYNRIVTISGSSFSTGMPYGFGIYNRRAWGDDESFVRYYSENNGTLKPRVIVYSNYTAPVTSISEAPQRVGVTQ